MSGMALTNGSAIGYLCMQHGCGFERRFHYAFPRSEIDTCVSRVVSIWSQLINISDTVLTYGGGSQEISHM